LVDRTLSTRRAGRSDLADVFVRAAEGLIATALPAHADAIASIASRKGDGRSIGSALAQHLSPASAAAVNVIWLLRGARRPAIDALAEAFRDDPIFNDTIRVLCARAFPPESPPAPSMVEDVRPPVVETAAAYRR
jgi:hypothetical protein